MFIRQATLKDTPYVIALIQELAQSDGETSPISPADVAIYLAQPGSVILLVESEKEILGLLSYSIRHDLYHAAKTCTIETLIVRSDARGMGTGSALLKEVLARGMKEGWAEVSVTTMPDNQEAQAFYRKHGLVDEAIYLEKHF